MRRANSRWPRNPSTCRRARPGTATATSVTLLRAAGTMSSDREKRPQDQLARYYELSADRDSRAVLFRLRDAPDRPFARTGASLLDRVVTR